MRLSEEEARRRASTADHGVLATLHERRGVDAVPATFVLDGDLVAIPIDRVKAKTSTSLQRVRNLESDPRAALLLEQWDPDDWSRLWWVRLTLERTEPHAPAIDQLTARLRAKYPPYEGTTFDAVLTFRVVAIAGWSER